MVSYNNTEKKTICQFDLFTILPMFVLDFLFFMQYNSYIMK